MESHSFGLCQICRALWNIHMLEYTRTHTKFDHQIFVAHHLKGDIFFYWKYFSNHLKWKASYRCLSVKNVWIKMISTEFKSKQVPSINEIPWQMHWNLYNNHKNEWKKKTTDKLDQIDLRKCTFSGFVLNWFISIALSAFNAL